MYWHIIVSQPLKLSGTDNKTALNLFSEPEDKVWFLRKRPCEFPFAKPGLIMSSYVKRPPFRCSFPLLRKSNTVIVHQNVMCVHYSKTAL